MPHSNLLTKSLLFLIALLMVHHQIIIRGVFIFSFDVWNMLSWIFILGGCGAVGIFFWLQRFFFFRDRFAEFDLSHIFFDIKFFKLTGLSAGYI